MRLDIQFFTESGHIEFGKLNDAISGLSEVASTMKSWWDALVSDVVNAESAGALYSTDGSEDFSDLLKLIEPDFYKLIDIATDLAKELASNVTGYEQVSTQVNQSISDWGATFKNALQNIVGGLTSTVPKGSYSVQQYLSDVSAEGQVIINSAANIFGRTGDVIKSTTGYNIIEHAQNFASGIMDWVGKLGGSSTGVSFVNGLFG